MGLEPAATTNKAVRAAADALLGCRFVHVSAAGGGEVEGWMRDRICAEFGIKVHEPRRLGGGQHATEFRLCDRHVPAWTDGRLAFTPSVTFAAMSSSSAAHRLPAQLIDACGRSATALDLAAYLVRRVGSDDVKRLAPEGRVKIPLSALRRRLGAVDASVPSYALKVKEALGRICPAWPELDVEHGAGKVAKHDYRDGRSAVLMLGASPPPPENRPADYQPPPPPKPRVRTPKAAVLTLEWTAEGAVIRSADGRSMSVGLDDQGYVSLPFGVRP
jgi:hypothetical protein